jgi:hypothetical protein
LVLGPEEVPVLIGPDAETAPELAVVSAVVHGAGPDGAEVLTSMLESVEKTRPEQAQSYIDEVLAVLPEAARRVLEAILETRAREYKSDFARKYYGQGRAEGKAEGEAHALLAVLAARGIEVPEWARERISETTDLTLLGSWIERVVSVESVEELFDPR